MLDMSMFRERVEVIKADHDRRGLPHDVIDEVIELDEAWRSKQYDSDQLRRKRNEAARGIAEAKKAGDTKSAEEMISKVSEIGEEISNLEDECDGLLERRDALRMRIPNILHEDVPIGEDDQELWPAEQHL